MQFDTKGEVDSSSRRQEVGIIASDGMVKKIKYDCFMRACRRERNSCVVFNTLKSPSIPRPVNH